MMEANTGGALPSTIFFDPPARSQSPPGSEQVVLRNAHGSTFAARVKCESFSAIAVAVESELFEVGDSVVVEYGDSTIAGTVRRVDEQDDGSWIVVLRWKLHQ